MKEDIDHHQLFELVSNDHALRGHDLKLYKQYNRLNTRKHFFSQRVIDAWNQLPSSVVDATSINSFKRNLDDFWKDMGIELKASFSAHHHSPIMLIILFLVSHFNFLFVPCGRLSS